MRHRYPRVSPTAMTTYAFGSTEKKRPQRGDMSTHPSHSGRLRRAPPGSEATHGLSPKQQLGPRAHRYPSWTSNAVRHHCSVRRRQKAGAFAPFLRSSPARRRGALEGTTSGIHGTVTESGLHQRAACFVDERGALRRDRRTKRPARTRHRRTVPGARIQVVARRAKIPCTDGPTPGMPSAWSRASPSTRSSA